MIHNRHKKGLNTNRISRAGSVVGDEMEGEDLPAELQISHEMVDKMLKISGDVSGQDCILVDDMIDTGSTIRLALEVLSQHESGRVYVLATHGIFSGSCIHILQEKDNLEKIVVTNSLPQENNKEKLGNKLE